MKKLYLILLVLVFLPISAFCQKQKLDPEDFFVRVEAVSETIPMDSTVEVSFYFYFRNANIVGINKLKKPQFKKFIAEEIKEPELIGKVRQGDKNYSTAMLCKYKLRPREKGVFELPTKDMTASILLEVLSNKEKIDPKQKVKVMEPVIVEAKITSKANKIRLTVTD